MGWGNPFDFLMKKKRLEEQLQLLNDKVRLYKRVFDSEDGQKVLEDLEKRCYIEQTTLSESAIKMAAKEGRRSVFMYIKQMISKEPEQILTQLREDNSGQP